MVNMYIESEGDLEFCIKHIMDLSKNGRKNFLTLGFPSENLYEVFIRNLHYEAFIQDIPHMDIEAQIILPPNEEDNYV
jgi:hypothetical protein